MTSFYAPPMARSPIMRASGHMPVPHRPMGSTNDFLPMSMGSERFGHSSITTPLHPYTAPIDNSKFQVERSTSPRISPKKTHFNDHHPDAYDQESLVFRENVKNLLMIRSAPFTVSGRIPLDPAHLVLFFRSKTGITHSLDFPIDVDFNTPPALEVLVATCRPPPEFPSVTNSGDLEGQSLFYPTNLPLTSSLELANHPILETVRNTLFPTLPAGNYLVAIRDKLEIKTQGQQDMHGSTGGMRYGVGSVSAFGVEPRRNPGAQDGRSATIIVTLPVRFRGGALVVHYPGSRLGDSSLNDEKFSARGATDEGLEWVAFLPDCEYSVETVLQGCRVSISYGVFTKTFGPSGMQPDPLIVPSDRLLDALAPVLNMSRGKKIGFYLGGDYSVNPSEAVADSIVPLLKGGDSLLYHALKASNLAPELHWTAGGYLWPLDRSVEIPVESQETDRNSPVNNFPLPFGAPNGQRYNPRAGYGGVPAVRGAFTSPHAYREGDASTEGLDDLADRVIDSGAISLEQAAVTVMTEEPASVIGKERVAFVSEGQLDRLVVNVLMVVYVP